MWRAQRRLKKKHENNLGLFNHWLGCNGYDVIAVWKNEMDESTGKVAKAPSKFACVHERGRNT